MGNKFFRPILLQEDLDCPHLTVLNAKLQQGANPNALITVKHVHSPAHYTPLAYALIHRNLACVTALLEHGADPNRVAGFASPLGLKPLHLASALGKLPELTSLLAHGADPNCTTSLSLWFGMPTTASFVPGANFDHTTGGDTPLHIAVDSGRLDVAVALLRQPNIDVNKLNDRERPPLYKACKRGRLDIATALTQHPGVDVDAGRPLFAAISARSPALVDLLIRSGASMQATDKGQTPMQHVVTLSSVFFVGRADMILQLHQAGADVNCQVQPGVTPLDYARTQRWSRVESSLLQVGALTHAELMRRGGERRADGPAVPLQQQAAAAGAARQAAAQSTAAAAAAAGAPAPTPARARGGSSAAPAPAPKLAPAVGRAAAARAPAPEPVPPSAPPLVPATGPDTGKCCVCLHEPAVLGFVHASVVHTCLCEGCKAALQGSSRGLRTCLICNAPAAALLRVVGT